MRWMRLRRIAGSLLLILAVSLVGTDVYGKLGKSKPIQIAFKEKPSKEVNPDEIYTLEVSWDNKDKRYTYEGGFVFIVEGKKSQVTASDLTFTFEGSVINPQESASSLMYHLPNQTFPAEGSGTVTVKITYHSSKQYSWEIGVTGLT
jgi:hypothetical protein